MNVLLLGKAIEINAGGNIALVVEDDIKNTVYGSVLIDESNGIFEYIWEFKIDKLAGYNEQVYISIDSSNKFFTDTDFSDTHIMHRVWIQAFIRMYIW